MWEAPPPHTTWPPPTSTYGLGGGERQQTAKPSQTGVGFHGNQGARRKGGTPDPAVPLSTLPRPQSLSQGPPKTLHPLLSALGASWACHEHSLPCAQGMSVTWVLPGQDRQPKKESSVQVHPHQQSHEAPSVLCDGSQGLRTNTSWLTEPEGLPVTSPKGPETEEVEALWTQMRATTRTGEGFVPAHTGQIRFPYR